MCQGMGVVSSSCTPTLPGRSPGLPCRGSEAKALPRGSALLWLKELGFPRDSPQLASAMNSRHGLQ